MEIRVNRVEFLHELIHVAGACETKTTIPILSHVLLRVIDGRLELSATDLDVSMSSSCDGEAAEEGAIAMQGKKLLEVVRASDVEELTLRVAQEGVLSLVGGRAQVKLRGLSKEDFPTLPVVSDDQFTTVSFQSFRTALGRVLHAVPSSDARFVMPGALIVLGESGVVAVATDGHRLCLVESAADSDGKQGFAPAGGVVVPMKALVALYRTDSLLPLRIGGNDHHLSFTSGRRCMICRIIEGKFPDFDPVIRNDGRKAAVTVDRLALAAVVRRVALMASDRARSVRIGFTYGKLVFSSANPDLGEADDEVECEYLGPDRTAGNFLPGLEGVAFALSPDYLIQALGALDTIEVRLEMTDRNSGFFVYPVGAPDVRCVEVIMPIRIDPPAGPEA